MPARKPPDWEPHTDNLAKKCGIQPVSFGSPIPAMTWCHYCGYLAQSRDHITPRGLKAQVFRLA